MSQSPFRADDRMAGFTVVARTTTVTSTFTYNLYVWRSEQASTRYTDRDLATAYTTQLNS